MSSPLLLAYLLALSSAVSAFGWAYLVAPVVVLCLAVQFMGTRSTRTYERLLAGGATATVATCLAIAIVEQLPRAGYSGGLAALAVNLAACAGALLGVTGYVTFRRAISVRRSIRRAR